MYSAQGSVRLFVAALVIGASLVGTSGVVSNAATTPPSLGAASTGRPALKFFPAVSQPAQQGTVWAIDGSATKLLTAWVTETSDGGTGVFVGGSIVANGAVTTVPRAQLSPGGFRTSGPVVAISESGERVAAMWCQQSGPTAGPQLVVTVGRWDVSGIAWAATQNLGACWEFPNQGALGLPSDADIQLSADGSRIVVVGDQFITAGLSDAGNLAQTSVKMPVGKCRFDTETACIEQGVLVKLSKDGRALVAFWNQRTAKTWPATGFEYSIQTWTATVDARAGWSEPAEVPLADVVSIDRDVREVPVAVAMSRDGSVMHVAQMWYSDPTLSLGRPVISAVRHGTSWTWGEPSRLGPARGTVFYISTSDDGSRVVATWKRMGVSGQYPTILLAASGTFGQGVTSWKTPVTLGSAPASGCPGNLSLDASGRTAALPCGTDTWVGYSDDGNSWVAASSADRGVNSVQLASDGTRLLRVSISYVSSGLTLTIEQGTVTDALPKPPSAPQGLKVATSGGGTSTVLKASWLAPLDTGGSAVSGYQYRIQTGMKWTAWTKASSSPVSVNVARTPRVTAFQVRAVTAVGPGVPATAKVRTPA